MKSREIMQTRDQRIYKVTLMGSIVKTEDKIEEIVYRDALVSDIHKLHTRRIGSIIAIEMHLRLPGEISLEESHHHATSIEKALRDEFGQSTHIMLHIEPVK